MLGKVISALRMQPITLGAIKNTSSALAGNSWPRTLALAASRSKPLDRGRRELLERPEGKAATHGDAAAHDTKARKSVILARRH